MTAKITRLYSQFNLPLYQNQIRRYVSSGKDLEGIIVVIGNVYDSKLRIYII